MLQSHLLLEYALVFHEIEYTLSLPHITAPIVSNRSAIEHTFILTHYKDSLKDYVLTNWVL